MSEAAKTCDDEEHGESKPSVESEAVAGLLVASQGKWDGVAAVLQSTGTFFNNQLTGTSQLVEPRRTHFYTLRNLAVRGS